MKSLDDLIGDWFVHFAFIGMAVVAVVVLGGAWYAAWWLGNLVFA